ncbi:MAG: alpha/beta hydrolase [Planctomycetales bacterium]|nr:alpha/beta hydrolase [Planctomycetales bacterium]
METVTHNPRRLLEQVDRTHRIPTRHPEGDVIVKRILSIVALLFLATYAVADEPKRLADVAYGNHPRQVLDFYQAMSDEPTPVVFYIHGGGWQGGDKKTNPKAFLDKGISVVAINYRYVRNGVEEKVEPPVKAPLEDAARALQFVRSKASEWNLDKTRIGATGGSAGACSSLWLAFHDDLADPNSDDPIAHESTRLYCAAVNGAQVSLDPKELREWMPNYGYGAHAFGLPSFQSLIDNREEVLKWIKEYSPIEHASKDDPPIAMFYGGEVPVVGASPKDPTHSAIMGVKLEERLKMLGVDVVLVHTDRPHPMYKNSTDYLIHRLLE